MMRRLTTLNARFDGWLRAPEPNAAGRMSLYRIIYGLFFLSTLPALTSYYAQYAPLPAGEWQPIDSIAWLNPAPPPPILYQWMPLLLAFALVLVTLGLWTRPATLVVLIAGVFLTGVFFSYKGKIDHGNTYLIAYIPAIMLFARWDSHYSINALLRRRRGKPTIDPTDRSWVYSWPMRAVILLLSLMFFGAGLTKILGDWVVDTNTLSGIFLDANRKAVLRQTTLYPLNVPLAQIPLLMIPLQATGVLIQLLFPLNLINRRFRTLFFAIAALFHVFNRLFLGLNTYNMLIAYIIIVDWEALLGRYLRRGERLSRLPTPLLIGGGLGLAALVTLVATQVSFADQLPVVEYGLWLAAPIALFFILKSGLAILREDILPRLNRRRGGTSTPARQH